MASLILIPWPETTWSLAGRMIGRSPVSLTEQGRKQALAWADALEKDPPVAVYSSTEVASVETARVLEKRANIKRKELKGLAEVNVGLWDGLTTDELKRRYPKIYKRWCDDPFAVCPPEGEEFSSASERIREGIVGIVGDRRDRTLAIVLGPFSFALARSIVERSPVVDIHDIANAEPLRYPWLPASKEKSTSTVVAASAVAAKGN